MQLQKFASLAASLEYQKSSQDFIGGTRKSRPRFSFSSGQSGSPGGGWQAEKPGRRFGSGLGPVAQVVRAHP
jgi:hypothetical protein